MLNYGFIAAFSRELVLKGSCWNMKSSNTHVNSFQIADVVLWNHHNIITRTPPGWFPLDYRLIIAFSRKFFLNDSYCTTESSQHPHVNSS